jgi:hypothetical protein
MCRAIRTDKEKVTQTFRRFSFFLSILLDNARFEDLTIFISQTGKSVFGARNDLLEMV